MSFKQQYGRNWILTGYRCLLCGGHMILNWTGHECSERFCNYHEGSKGRIRPLEDFEYAEHRQLLEYKRQLTAGAKNDGWE